MKTKKEKQLAQIYKIMRQNGLTVNDVEQYFLQHQNSRRSEKLSDEFDLLCLIGGQKERVAFSQRHLGTRIGIFPFKDEPEYIELKEVEGKKHTDKDVDESRLLDENFCCARVSKVVDRLNLYLKAMNEPILEGSYLADNKSYMPGCGWIIGFNNTGDYHGGNVPAKLRYMGKFYPSKTF